MPALCLGSGGGRGVKLDRDNILVQGRSLTFAYEGAPVVKDVDITLRRGEIVTLVGPNGAGKSSLAKLLVGILKAKSGELRHARNCVIGYVPQHLRLDSTLPITVDRFVALGNSARDRGRPALERLGVAGLARRQMQSLSGGQLQRVLLARALSRKPDLLVLDEPGQGLDLDGQGELSWILAAERDAGKAVLLISHDLSLVLSCTDRVLCIDTALCCAGPPEAIVRDPAYLRSLGPQAGQALALYRQHRGGGVVPLERQTGSV